MRSEMSASQQARNKELHARIASLTASLAAAESERDRMAATIDTQGRDHAAHGCTFGPLCPWCEIENLRGQLAATYSRAVEEFAEWLDGKASIRSPASRVADFLASRKEHGCDECQMTGDVACQERGGKGCASRKEHGK
jgi:hypothetical protein